MPNEVATTTLISYIVGGATAIGTLYLTVIKFITDCRDKRQEAANKAIQEQIQRGIERVRIDLQAATQAAFIEQLQEQSIALSNEINIVKSRQRRGIAIQLGSAMIFFVLLIGLFIYEKEINQQLSLAAIQGGQTAETANTANKKSTEAVDEVKAAAQQDHLRHSPSHKKRPTAE